MHVCVCMHVCVYACMCVCVLVSVVYFSLTIRTKLVVSCCSSGVSGDFERMTLTLEDNAGSEGDGRPSEHWL